MVILTAFGFLSRTGAFCWAAGSEAYGKLPLSFEANRGQSDPQVKFLARGRGYTLFLTPTEGVLVLTSGSSRADENLAEQNKQGQETVLRMKLLGAHGASQMAGLDELPGESHYFLGSDPSQWHTHIPSYSRVKYEEVYPGVDLLYYGRERQLEYDFIVAPGADPEAIRLHFQGAERVEVDAQGDLLLDTADGEVRLRKPLVYQDVDGIREEISGGFKVNSEYDVGFELGVYDATRPLVIDPVLEYSTYLGGSNTESGESIAVDPEGSAYVTGHTRSADFPTMDPLQPAFGGEIDLFVTKLNPAGSALVYSTYLGGSDNDTGWGIAVDSQGNAYVTGHTQSADFPIMNPLQAALGGSADAFVAKLDPAGSALIYSTYLGGKSFDGGNGIGLDPDGNAYVTGSTSSFDFPTMNPLQAAKGGSQDAFVTQLNPGLRPRVLDLPGRKRYRKRERNRRGPGGQRLCHGEYPVGGLSHSQPSAAGARWALRCLRGPVESRRLRPRLFHLPGGQLERLRRRNRRGS